MNLEFDLEISQMKLARHKRSCQSQLFNLILCMAVLAMIIPFVISGTASYLMVFSSGVLTVSLFWSYQLWSFENQDYALEKVRLETLKEIKERHDNGTIYNSFKEMIK